MHINTLQMVSFELFPHKFNLSAIFGLRNLHFCCCGVHGEFLNDDNVNYMAVVGFHAANFIQFLIEMTYHKGGFQLLDLIITELKSHMTCYNSMPLIG